MNIKLISYNIHKGFDLGNREFLLAEMKKYLHHLQPDLVFLQEVVGDHRHQKMRIENWPTNTQFEFLADEIWPHFAYGKNAVYDDGHHGNAILSKFPLVSWDNTDLSTNNLEFRGLAHGKILIPETGQGLDVFCTHLNLLQGARFRQLKKIIETIKAKVPIDAPMILAGDFNDWTGALCKPLLQELNLREAFTVIRGSTAKTFPAFWPKLGLDRIYFRNLEVVDVKVLESGSWAKLSDHLPIWASLKLLEQNS